MGYLSRRYWDNLTRIYQEQTTISCGDFHYGPLLPGDSAVGLLPADVGGLRCLELGCGAGQNSIYLASRGAQCSALDLSGEQLACGRELAVEHNVTVDFIQGDLASLPFRHESCFDLVHSVYALPFVEDQSAAVVAAASLAKPGGVLLLSTAHPLSTGEWWEEEDGEPVVLVRDYFQPIPDVRTDAASAVATCRPVPTSDTFAWLSAAGLTVTAFLEPRPLPVAEMSERLRREHVPYYSEAWCERHGELARAPFVAIFRAVRPTEDCGPEFLES